MIRLGICTDIGRAEVMKEIGYDYVEMNLSGIAALDEEGFASLKKQVKESPLPVEATNCMLPGGFSLCREGALEDSLKAYLAKAFTRAGELGVKVAVFGSGGARNLPEGMSEEEGMKYLAAFLKYAGPLAAEQGITIAVEPLRRAECNIINTVAQAQKLAAMADEPNVKSLADLYHMMSGNEAYDALDNGIGVVHTHIAERLTRAYPKKGDGSEKDYEAFFAKLHSAGYDGRVSVEGGCKDFAEDAKLSFELLHEYI